MTYLLLNRQPSVTHEGGQLTTTLLEGWVARRRRGGGSNTVVATSEGGGTTPLSTGGGWRSAGGEELDLLGGAASRAHGLLGDFSGVGAGGSSVRRGHHVVVGQHLGQHLLILHIDKRGRDGQEEAGKRRIRHRL